MSSCIRAGELQGTAWPLLRRAAEEMCKMCWSLRWTSGRVLPALPEWVPTMITWLRACIIQRLSFFCCFSVSWRKKNLGWLEKFDGKKGTLVELQIYPNAVTFFGWKVSTDQKCLRKCMSCCHKSWAVGLNGFGTYNMGSQPRLVPVHKNPVRTNELYMLVVLSFHRANHLQCA